MYGKCVDSNNVHRGFGVEETKQFLVTLIFCITWGQKAWSYLSLLMNFPSFFSNKHSVVKSGKFALHGEKCVIFFVQTAFYSSNSEEIYFSPLQACHLFSPQWGIVLWWNWAICRGKDKVPVVSSEANLL